MRPPDFWYPQFNDKQGVLGKTVEWMLTPAGFVYDMAGRIGRTLASPASVGVPIICIGNLSVGGTGKTPVSLAIAELLQAKGLRPHFLSRGYGGTEKGPTFVDLDHHTASDVGDEPLLLAARAPTVVSANRVEGAQTAVRNEADVIVMDDGYQNPTLKKDVSLLVVDREAEFGNGRVFPAGPLRESISAGVRRADAIILTATSDRSSIPFPTAPKLKKRLAHAPPIIEAVIRPNEGIKHTHPYVAFAGIGRPKKFFDTLREMEVELVLTRAFPDHHKFEDKELDDLRRLAVQREAKLITTEKDAARMDPKWRRLVETLPVSIHFQDPAALDAVLKKALKRPEKNA